MESEDDDGVKFDGIVVIDVGTTTCKVGFSHHEKPCAEIPTAIGYSKLFLKILSDLCKKEYFAGDEIFSSKGFLNISYPVERGIVKNWNDMGNIYHYIFQNELRIEPEKHPVLLIEHPLNPITNRERLLQIMFEKFNVPALYIACNAELVLQDAGCKTGVVLDSGCTITNAVPVYEGCTITNAVQSMNYGGNDLTKLLIEKLKESGYDDTGSRESFLTAKKIKESVLYVAFDYEEELKNIKPYSYISYEECFGVNVEKEQINVTETLFSVEEIQTSAEEIQVPAKEVKVPTEEIQASAPEPKNIGVHRLIYNSILKCNPDIQKDLWANIVLAGGNTMFSGFPERLKKELEQLAPPDTEINVYAQSERKYAAWRGGSSIASKPDFLRKCIKKQDYMEHGPSIVHEKSS